jgi:4-amino-4-deoxy-L-arabinose transferase-like glycosyltransferase
LKTNAGSAILYIFTNMPAIPSKFPSLSKTSTLWRVLFVLFIVSFYLFGLDIPLLGPDEPRYAQVAREMFERGDWITPTLGGFNWFEKPALLYWLQIASYNLFGISEFSARFGPAVFGLGTIFALWLLGRTAQTRWGLTDLADHLAMLAASTIGIIVFSRGASFDIVLTFPITAALVSFYLYESGQPKTNIPLILFYVFVGISVLAKGLVGLLPPGAIVALYYLLIWKIPPKRVWLSLAWGSVVAVSVASIWYLPMYVRHGYEFIDQFFIQHHFQRYTSNKYQHPQPFHFFFWVLPLMTIPWLPFFLTGFWRAVRDRVRFFSVVDNTENKPEASLHSFALSWTIVPVLFFSLSGSKLPGYVLPALPGAVILAALAARRFTDSKPKRRFMLLAVTVLFISALAVALVTTVPQFAEADSVRGLLRKADDAGLSQRRVLMFHTVVHNAEFYAAGRIARDPDGTQLRIVSLDQLAAEIGNRGGSALVFMQIPYIEQIRSDARFTHQYLGDNGEHALVSISLR